jgi:RNA polymerase sigma-70 factor (ECF subfamily)
MAADNAVSRSGRARIAPDRTTHALLAGLRAQDPAVAAPLWHEYAPSVFRMLRRALGPDAAVGDAVRVVLLCVFHRGPRLGPRADLRQLVLRVTARIAEGELRRRPVRWLAAASRARGAGKPMRDAALSPADAVGRFYRVLDRLSAPARIAFVLHYIEGLDVSEVAAATGSSPARTLRRLRQSLGKVADGIEDDEQLRLIGRSGSA